MNETLKYFRLSGGDIPANVVVACKPDEVELLHEKCAGYTLEETERPEDAQIVSASLCINPPADLDDVYANVKITKYEGPNCRRCQNRFRYSEYCSCHYRQTKPCYRFKLER